MSFTLVKLKERLESDENISDIEKEKILRNAEATTKIHKIFEKHKIDDMDSLDILVGAVCGAIVSCKSPFRALSAALQCASEYYSIFEHMQEKKDEGKDRTL